MQASFSIEEDGFFETYAALWQKHDQNSFFRSPSYIKIITSLTDSRAVFATMKGSSGEFVSAIPLAIKSGPKGDLYNSLPYFGTCGAVVGPDDPSMRRSMLKALVKSLANNKAAGLTLVDDWQKPHFGACPNPDYVSERSNQFVILDNVPGGKLLESYHQKTRNLVRKALRNGIAVRKSADKSEIFELLSVHQQNMSDVGGTPKARKFFELITDDGREIDYELFIASHEGADIAFLLLIYCGNTVEYYMPAIRRDSRPLNPMNAAIYIGMLDAIERGYKYWNWGGTWPSQHNLRHFKSRWGSQETSYKYYSYVFNQELISFSAEQMLEHYPNFFIAPFDQLENQRGKT